VHKIYTAKYIFCRFKNLTLLIVNSDTVLNQVVVYR